jgi:hypothetical protein
MCIYIYPYHIPRIFGPNPLLLDRCFISVRRRAAAKLDLMDRVDVTLDDLSPWVARRVSQRLCCVFCSRVASGKLTVCELEDG